MSDIEWREGNIPVSKQFDDPYYSRSDGRQETKFVFIESNQLLTRWQEMKDCTIAELGFGTGLNFLETIHHWPKIKPQNAKLHFISYEQFPMKKEEMQMALSAWPELAEDTKMLAEIWQQNANKLDHYFSDDIRLTVHIGDANTLLPKQTFQADAWYLDGFAPAKNPELWNEKLMAEVASHTAPKGTFATYTAAGFVKRGLQAAGFEVQKVKGFGTKRDMLIGKLTT